ncbi:MAG TPA: TonB-dependent receptor, partial [Nitrospira sp.]|nr:TonB-dependent receptor [Nitrospira sp.]
LDYRFSPEVLAYATVSTGFKGGGVTARPFNAAQARLGVFGPETLTAYEVGLKTDLFGRRLRVNLAGFINDYKDVQLQIQDCSNYGGGPICAVIANAGDARFKGVEAEFTARPIDGLDIDGSVSYIHAKWKRLSPAVIGDPATRPNGVFLDDPATSAPKWKASAGVQYRIDLGASGSLTPRADYSYTGRRFQSRAALVPYYLPSYSLVNASLTWRDKDEKFAVILEARNLTKEYYYTARFDALFLPTGTTFSTVGRPREFILKARYSF